MIKVNDYIIVNDFGYKLICKVKAIGDESKKIRKISVLVIDPYLGPQVSSIIVDISKIKVLNLDEKKIIKCLYE